MYPNILISGLARHGKDTIAAILVQAHGYERVAFGDALRDEIVSIYEASPMVVDVEFLTKESTKETPDERLALIHCSELDYVTAAMRAFENEDAGMTLGSRLQKPRSPRRIQQTYATEYRRSQNEYYWIEAAQRRINGIDGPVVVCDGRSVSELNWAKANAFERMHVVRPGYANISAAKHSSEVIPDPDEETWMLTNLEGAPDLLKSQIERVMQELIARREVQSLQARAVQRELVGS